MVKRKFLYGALILILLVGAGYMVFIKKDPKGETITIRAGEFLQQVSVSGKVVSAENVDLSFEQSGMVRGVYVKVGANAAAGKLLASQDTAQLYTQLSEMQAGIDLQKAKLGQLLAGASDQDILAAEDDVASAKQYLKNAYEDALVDLDGAYNDIYNAKAVALDIQNSYFSSPDQQGVKVQQARIDIETSLSISKTAIDSAKNTVPETVDSVISQVTLQLGRVYTFLGIIRSQCDEGIYYPRVSAADKTSLNTQKATINTAIASLNTSTQNITNYKIALTNAEHDLEAVKAAARPTDIAVFQAQIKQAEAGAQNVLTQIRKRQIYSPITGVVTEVNAKTGSIFSSGTTAISVISAEAFQVESYVPEIYISQVKAGNEAEATFDAYGTGKVFIAKVISIDPAETIKDGVATYKVKLELKYNGDEIKNGMTSNVIITTDKKANVISIPQGAVVSRDGKKTVKVSVGEDIIEKEVVTGSISLSGQVEIISGLQENDIIVLP